ncbi:Lrp/AsnC family transcriptional regulator [Flavisphingomonas formosensis]|uniref:Lrp/AsnC family transcriptional regulator n=1 Tax=Flavisphingomonas formosensis TaxID=861534 RepID=UPI0012F73072|nr:Lrp/AsnC family transcriptional regulator [Sphingomonas formosensis]
MTKPSLDTVDREIIQHLSNDARMSNRAVADLLGVTEGTIRARLKRLREAGLIRFTALTNLSRLGGSRVIFIRVKVHLSQVRKVAELMTQMDELKCVIVTTGPYNILAMGTFGEADLGAEEVVSRIGTLPGVHGLETSITIQVIKYNVRTAKILTPQQDLDSADDE